MKSFKQVNASNKVSKAIPFPPFLGIALTFLAYICGVELKITQFYRTSEATHSYCEWSQSGTHNEVLQVFLLGILILIATPVKL